MARIRTIKPEFWKNERLSALPEATHLLAAALLNYADDYGYFNANPELIQAELSPLREPSVNIPESLRNLQTIDYIRIGQRDDGRCYGCIVGFTEHQRVSHPTDSKISCLPIAWDELQNVPENIGNPPEPFRPEQGTGNREGEQGTGNGESAQARPPKKAVSKGTRWESGRVVDPAWLEWARENSPGVDARSQAVRFADYWVGVAGQRGVKRDWQATWRNWIRRSTEQQKGNGDGRSESRRKRDTQREAAAELLADTSDDPPTALRDGGQNQGRVEDNP